MQYKSPGGRPGTSLPRKLGHECPKVDSGSDHLAMCSLQRRQHPRHRHLQFDQLIYTEDLEQLYLDGMGGELSVKVTTVVHMVGWNSTCAWSKSCCCRCPWSLAWPLSSRSFKPSKAEPPPPLWLARHRRASMASQQQLRGWQPSKCASPLERQLPFSHRHPASLLGSLPRLQVGVGTSVHGSHDAPRLPVPCV